MSHEPDRRRSRQPTAEELALWRHITRDTTPIGKMGPPAPPEPLRPPSSPPPSPSPTPARPAVPVSQPPPRPQPASHGIDRRTLQRLGRGLVPIDARLDLHGMTQEEAHRHLGFFLAHHQRRGARCILVITGIGERSTGGILRTMTPRWLAEPPNAQRVIAHAPAQRHHGGAGALYVLLRRLR
ncbi:MAG: Smr/MutS family protein [Geminicoccaceae bacterium]|nr:Smr/MutS family protein [Geminicoccaceae bacterium]MCB9966309.1 Smr/MutS family protein [Geminicoccaceae bacterium]HRY26847.1 Smr/MutS family protein [Geminicoccaceae bacterium]